MDTSELCVTYFLYEKCLTTFLLISLFCKYENIIPLNMLHGVQDLTSVWNSTLNILMHFGCKILLHKGLYYYPIAHSYNPSTVFCNRYLTSVSFTKINPIGVATFCRAACKSFLSKFVVTPLMASTSFEHSI